MVYEETIIPYVSSKDNKIHNYIVDFTDKENKTIYEVKPSSRQIDQLNVDKFKYAEEWCIENGYTFEIIDEFYLRDNTTTEIFAMLPDDIKRRLKCFAK